VGRPDNPGVLCDAVGARLPRPTSIRLGSKLFTAAQIRDIVENLDVVLFPR